MIIIKKESNKNTMTNSSVFRQKGESQNGGHKKTKHDKFFEKNKTFLAP